MGERRWRSVGEGVAVAGVIVSLIFVGFELRQSTVTARAEAYQEIGLTIAEFWYNDALNPELIEITWRAEAGDSLSATELHQARSRLNAILRLWETLWLNVDTGALPPEAMHRMGSWSQMCENPLFRRDWDSFFGPRLGEGFVNYVTETCGLSS